MNNVFYKSFNNGRVMNLVLYIMILYDVVEGLQHPSNGASE